VPLPVLYCSVNCGCKPLRPGGNETGTEKLPVPVCRSGAYRHALEALDRARMNADRQHIYIADFVQPRLPEKALCPRRLRALGIVFVIAFATWAIGCLTVRSVRDHL